MKWFMIPIMTVVLMAGVVYAQDTAPTKKLDDYTVTANFDKHSPAVGENPLLITVKDQAGKSITDATVNIDYYMSEKVSATRKSIEMPYMAATAAARVKSSGYNATLNFTMPGRWVVSIKIMRDGKERIADFFINI